MSCFIALRPQMESWLQLGPKATSVKNVEQFANLTPSYGWNSVTMPKKPSTIFNYHGKRYQIIKKKERHVLFQKDRSFKEYAKRCFLGLIAIVCSLGLALLFRPVRELFNRQEVHSKKELTFIGNLLPSASRAKRSLPSTTFPQSRVKKEYEKSKKKLENGIALSEETISKVQSCMGDILKDIRIQNIRKRNKENGVIFYGSQLRHRVFTVNTAPGIIFKLDTNPNDPSMQNRFRNMIKAETVIRTNHLKKLIVPKAKLFTISYQDRKYDIIAEQKLNVDATNSLEKENYKKAGRNINQAIAQLSFLICKLNYLNDIEQRNFPILKDGTYSKFCLIDLEELMMSGEEKTAEAGLFGVGEINSPHKRSGLIRCVYREDQAKIIKKIAEENNISTRKYKARWEERKEELNIGKTIKKFYKKKGIRTGKELIQVDIQNINFLDHKSIHPDAFSNIKKQNLQKKFLKIAETLINQINKHLKKENKELEENNCFDTIREHRDMIIDYSLARLWGNDWWKCLEGTGKLPLFIVLDKLKELGIIYQYKELVFGRKPYTCQILI